MRPEFPEVKKLGIEIVPLEIKFYENGEFVPYNDLDISSKEFYERMRDGKKLPQTNGAVQGNFIKMYEKLKDKTNAIVSVHITSVHSGAWSTAVGVKKMIQEEKPDLAIEVLDSKNISYATWILAELAADRSNKGNSIEEIKAEVLETVPKIQTLIALETLDNAIAGGRTYDALKARLGRMLNTYPILGLEDGRLKEIDKVRTRGKARQRVIEMAGDSGPLVKVAVVHTNAQSMAEVIKESLKKVYKENIPVYEAGPALGVHGGEGAIGIVFQKK